MANKAIFLDRDDTIIDDSGYINDPQQVKLLPQAGAAIADFRKMGYKIIVVSNQSGIARGIITEKVLGEIHEKLKQLLAKENAYIDRIYYCPYHPEGIIPKYKKQSDCRKPQPGMLLAAAKDINIGLENSWMIGNAYRDVAAGKNAGCKTILIKSHTKMPVKKLDDPAPNFEAINLREAVNIIKREIAPKPQPKPELPESIVEKTEAQLPSETKAESENLQEAQEKIPLENEEQIEEIKEKEIEKAETTEIVETENQEPEKKETLKKSKDHSRTEKLLEEIKLLMQSNNRQKMYSEFSVLKFAAGFMQMLVLACLFIAVRYKMLPQNNDSSVFSAIGFAVVFQLIVITLCLVHKEK